jgi:hypothetical protein
VRYNSGSSFKEQEEMLNKKVRIITILPIEDLKEKKLFFPVTHFELLSSLFTGRKSENN